MAPPKTLKIASNQCKSSKYWWEVWILERDHKKNPNVHSSKKQSMQAFPKERKGNIFFGRNLAILSMMRVEEEEEKNAVTRKSELFLVVKQHQEQKTVSSQLLKEN